jgi:hypothetical protein
MILEIIFWVCTSITFGCLLFAIGFLVKIHNWKMRGYNETYQALANGRLREVKDPIEMKFNSIENKMYHIGAYEAYRDFRNIFNDDDEEY